MVRYLFFRHNSYYFIRRVFIIKVLFLDMENLRGCVDDKTWTNTLENLKAMLNATQGICSNSQEGDIKVIIFFSMAK